MRVGEHPTGMLRKLRQNRIFLWREVHILPGPTNAPRKEIDFEFVDLHDRLSVACRTLAQGTAKAGENLVSVEGLRHIIVGAEIESGDLFLRRLTSRDDEQGRSGLHDKRNEFEAFSIGQSKVEQHGVGLIDGKCVLCFASSSSFNDCITGALQGGHEQSADRWLIIDDDNFVGIHSVIAASLTSADSGKRMVKQAPGPSSLLRALS